MFNFVLKQKSEVRIIFVFLYFFYQKKYIKIYQKWL